MSTGAAKYDPSENSFTWTIHHFGGSSQHELRARFGLPKTESAEGPHKGPDIVHARVLFDIPYFTVSGIQVRYLKIIEKSGYNALPWVRYATRNGNYLVRMRFSES